MVFWWGIVGEPDKKRVAVHFVHQFSMTTGWLRKDLRWGGGVGIGINIMPLPGETDSDIMPL